MDASLFDYELSPEAIAQEPAKRREDSRLLVINRSTGQVKNHRFSELPEILEEKWHFVRNNVAVLKARLHGQRPNGGKVECLLVRPSAEDPLLTWWCLLKPAKKFNPSDIFTLEDGSVATIVQKKDEGMTLIRFQTNSAQSVSELSEQFGRMPLPPYIKRDKDDPRSQSDKDRYQTIYADPNKTNAAAAPTAGLHFSKPILGELENLGHQFHDLTLHVGLGTFKSISVQDLRDHEMHSEFYEIPHATLDLLRQDKILAVGTTSLRAIEDAFRKNAHQNTPKNQSHMDEADLFIYPPAHFRTNALLTNFHLPKSTLLCLVSAFLTPNSKDGIVWLKQIYQAALEKDYRFFSYGDAMLIL